MDVSAFHFLNSLSGRSPILDGLIVFSAVHLAYLALALAALFILKIRGTKERILCFVRIALACLLAKSVIVDTLWFFHDRVRPFEALPGVRQIIYVDNPSFPSGHAALFFALAVSVFYLTKSRSWRALFMVLAAVIGVARVAAGLHWPSDVLGGAFVGFASAALIWFLMRDMVAKFQPPVSSNKEPRPDRQGSLLEGFRAWL